MNVRDLIDSTYLPEGLIEVVGWLVSIEGQLFLLDENFADPYTESKKIQISDPLIAYAIRDVISPLGGGSFVFHKAKVIGVLEGVPVPKIKAQDLFIENDDHKEFVRVAIDKNTIKIAKKKYENIFIKKEVKSDDWLDYF